MKHRGRRDFRRFSPFASIEECEDGTIYVSGIASDETPDMHETIIDYEATKQAAEDWRRWGNIREMHGETAAGVAETITLDDAARTLKLRVHVVDPVAVAKVKTGVYKGFSIGGWIRDTIEDVVTGLTRVIDYVLVEISLVDRPSNPAAVFLFARRYSGKRNIMTETNVQLNRVVFEDDKEKERPAGSGNEETAPEGENQQEQPRNDGGDTADNQRREELDNGKENQQQTKEAADDGEGKVEATTSKSPEAQVLNVLLSALEQLGLIQVSQQPAPEPESNGDDGDGDGGMMDQRTITVKVPRVATMERGLSDKAPLAELNRVAGQVKDLSDELKRIAGRLDLLERAPAGEGPFAFDPTAAGVSSDSLAITQIRRFIDAEPDPQRRQAYERQLSEIMIANERRQGGHSLSLNS